MDFKLLGAFEMIEEKEDLTPTAPKMRQTVALLILRRNSVIQKDELIDELWDHNPPRSSTTTLQTYIHKLRRIFTEHGRDDLLQTKPTGYCLAVPDSAVDLHRFEETVSAGRAALGRGDLLVATELFSDALALWRGPALGGVITTGKLLTAYVRGLEETRLRTLELHVQINLQLGRHLELISELKSLTVMYAFHESFHASLMVALHRSARRNEALQVYHALRGKMVEELGLEPSPELRQIHQQVLSSDPQLNHSRPHELVAALG